MVLAHVILVLLFYTAFKGNRDTYICKNVTVAYTIIDINNVFNVFSTKQSTALSSFLLLEI